MGATPENTRAGGEQIVCVNNSHELLEMICMLLADEGYDPIPLPVAQGSIDEIRRLSPDAMILDLISSEEISWNLIEQVNRDPVTAEIPKIIVSTDPGALEMVRQEPLRYGGDRLLPKPFDVFELCEHLKQLLRFPPESTAR